MKKCAANVDDESTLRISFGNLLSSPGINSGFSDGHRVLFYFILFLLLLFSDFVVRLTIPACRRRCSSSVFCFKSIRRMLLYHCNTVHICLPWHALSSPHLKPRWPKKKSWKCVKYEPVCPPVHPAPAFSTQYLLPRSPDPPYHLHR